MARRPLIAGNWKMYKTPPEAADFCRGLHAAALPLDRVDVALFPPFVALAAAKEALSGSAIGLGAQNMHPASEGAYTGEVSANMLLTVGCQYVIIGHSERRTLFSEADAFVREKTEAALAAGLVPVVCVGEQLAERQAGRTAAVVKRQVTAAADGLSGRIESVVVAYEPVWAIGTGVVATPDQAQEVHAQIRGWLADCWGPVAETTRILYGGSVKPDNARALLSCADIDGALVGGASLKVETFKSIIEAAG